MVGEVVAREEFDRVAALHCAGWEARSIAAVRCLLVDGERLSEVANKFGMSPQQAVVLRTRFLDRVATAAVVKLPASEFMREVAPAHEDKLKPFTKDVKRLLRRGYSRDQIVEFLMANQISVTVAELNTFLGAMNENASPGKPKGRGR